MLKYYYVIKIGRSKYTDEELLDNPTLYIIDTENKIMMDILDDIIQAQEVYINTLSYTDAENAENAENEYVKLKKAGNNIILKNEAYKQDTKLINKINKYGSILFLADYNESYIPLIIWLMDQNARDEKNPENEKQIIKLIDFLDFTIKQKIIIRNNIEIINDYIIISGGYYNGYGYEYEDSDYTNLKYNKYFQYFQTIIHRYKLFINSLEWIPNNIEYLIINTGSFTQPINSLPNTLKYLSIKTGNFNQPLDNLPHSLEYLEINDNVFNQEINLLPFNLKYLSINSEEFNHSLDNLPPNLQKLYINSDSFTHTFMNLPTNLKTLHVSLYSNSTNENQIMDFTNLPNSLEYLYVNMWTICSIEKLIIPTNLKEINFPNMNEDSLLEKYPHLKKYDDYWKKLHIIDF